MSTQTCQPFNVNISTAILGSGQVRSTVGLDADIIPVSHAHGDQVPMKRVLILEVRLGLLNDNITKFFGKHSECLDGKDVFVVGI